MQKGRQETVQFIIFIRSEQTSGLEIKHVYSLDKNVSRNFPGVSQKQATWCCMKSNVLNDTLEREPTTSRTGFMPVETQAGHVLRTPARGGKFLGQGT